MRWFVAACTLAVFGMLAIVSSAAIPVSQKGKTFTPSQLEIERGESVVIPNDDDVVHHLFVDTPRFQFDSGPQRPGQSATIEFRRPGEYAVRCGIHPKMLLTVTVR